MGQAKRRGNSDQRIEQAKSEQLRQREAWDALPEEERQRVTRRTNQGIEKIRRRFNALSTQKHKTQIPVIEFRQYQSDAAEWISRRRRGMVISPAGSGKTLILAMAIAKVLERRGTDTKARIGRMCGTREQHDQGIAALEAFPIIAERAEWRVTCDPVRADFSDCDLLVVDECAHCRSAPTWQAAAATCPGALWGMTATPWGEDEDENAFLLKLFEQVYEIDRAEIGDKLTPAIVRIVDASDQFIEAEIERLTMKTYSWRRKYWKGDPQELLGQIRWLECTRRGIVANETRNRAAVELAQRHAGDSVLVLVPQIEHGYELQKRIPGAEMAHSKIGKKKRAQLIEDFRSGKIACLIASSILDEGFDAPIAGVLILVSGGKAEGRTIQRAGRVCRKFAGKEHAIIYDFVDRFHPLATKHAAKRQDIFRSLGYRIEADDYFTL